MPLPSPPKPPASNQAILPTGSPVSATGQVNAGGASLPSYVTRPSPGTQQATGGVTGSGPVSFAGQANAQRDTQHQQQLTQTGGVNLNIPSVAGTRPFAGGSSGNIYNAGDLGPALFGGSGLVSPGGFPAMYDVPAGTGGIKPEKPGSTAPITGQTWGVYGQPGSGTQVSTPPPTPPTPPIPQPVPGWVPTQDGQGWVPPDHPMAWKAGGAGAPTTPPTGGTGTGTRPPSPWASFALPEFNREDPIGYWQGILREQSDNLSPERRRRIEDIIRTEQINKTQAPEKYGISIREVDLFNQISQASLTPEQLANLPDDQLPVVQGTGWQPGPWRQRRDGEWEWIGNQGTGGGGTPPPPPPGGVPPPPPANGGSSDPTVYTSPTAPTQSFVGPNAPAPQQAASFSSAPLPTYQPYKYQTPTPDPYTASRLNVGELPVYKPGQAPSDPFATYKPGELPNAPLATYTPGQLPTDPLPQYRAGTLSQFSAPGEGTTDAQTLDLLQRMLASPSSLSDQTVAQMKERQKEGALSMQEQLLQQLAQSGAARGTYGGGFQGSQERRVGQDTISEILRGQRDIDIQKAMQDRTDLLNALSSSQGVLGERANRAQGNYNTLLGGQQAQEGLRQAEAQSGQNAGAFALQRALAQEGLSQAGVASQARAGEFDLNRALSREGLAQVGVQSQNEGSRFNLERFLGQENLNRLGTESGSNAKQFALQQALANEGLQQAGAASRLATAGFGRSTEELNAAQMLQGFLSQADARRFELQREQAQADENARAYSSQLPIAQYGLSRDMAQQGLNQAGADSAFRRQQTDVENKFKQQDLDRLLQTLGLQRDLGMGSLAVDWGRIGEGGRQFDLGHVLNIMSFLENQRQFNQGLGFDYTSLGVDAQGNLMNQLLGLV